MALIRLNEEVSALSPWKDPQHAPARQESRLTPGILEMEVSL